MRFDLLHENLWRGAVLRDFSETPPKERFQVLRYTHSALEEHHKIFSVIFLFFMIYMKIEVED